MPLMNDKVNTISNDTALRSSPCSVDRFAEYQHAPKTIEIKKRQSDLSDHKSHDVTNDENCQNGSTRTSVRVVQRLEEEEISVDKEKTNILDAFLHSVRDILCSTSEIETTASIKDNSSNVKVIDKLSRKNVRNRVSAKKGAQLERLEALRNEAHSSQHWKRYRQRTRSFDMSDLEDKINFGNVTFDFSKRKTKTITPVVSPMRKAREHDDFMSSDDDWMILCGGNHDNVCSESFEIVFSNEQFDIPISSLERSMDIGDDEQNKKKESDDLYYDSDVGDVIAVDRLMNRRSRVGIRRRKPREFEEVLSDHDCMEPSSNLFQFNYFGASNDLDLLHAIKCHPFTMTRHMSTQQYQANKVSFQSCIAWIEFGTQLKSTLVHPKLKWTTIHQSSLHTKRVNSKVLMNLDLLDIFRIRMCTDDDLRDYPFARNGKCFLIESTVDEKFVFETNDKRKSMTLIRGLKLLVSELAMKVALGSDYSDYFSPSGYNLN